MLCCAAMLFSSLFDGPRLLLLYIYLTLTKTNTQYYYIANITFCLWRAIKSKYRRKLKKKTIQITR